MIQNNEGHNPFNIKWDSPYAGKPLVRWERQLPTLAKLSPVNSGKSAIPEAPPITGGSKVRLMIRSKS